MQALPMSSCGVCLCVRVCVSVTFMNSVKTNKYIFEKFSPSGRPTILVFPCQTAHQYSDGIPLTGASNAGIKVKEGHTPKERKRGAHLPFIGRWARRWINHYCLWRMTSATPDLRLPSQHKLVLILPIHRGMARLSWPGWLVTYRDSLPAWRRSPIQALTGPSVA